jgi:hypothetical protein
MTEKIISGQDITQFITQERKKPNVSDIPQAFNLFTGILSKSIHDMYLKIKTIANIEIEAVIKTGADLLWHVFWIIYAFSFNIKLTVFLSERCILLFTEFIIMSRNPLLSCDLNFIPNINDAMQFSLKKTIENLTMPIIDSVKINQYLELHKIIAYDIKYLYQNIFNELSVFYVHRKILPIDDSNNVLKNDDNNLSMTNDTDNVEETFDFIENEYIEINKDIYIFLDTINVHVGKLICTIHKLEHSNKCIVYDLIKHIFTSEKTKTYNLKTKIFILKILLELYIELNSDKNYCYTQDTFNKLLNKVLEQVNEIKTININSLQNIKKRKLYKNLQSYIQELCS